MEKEKSKEKLITRGQLLTGLAAGATLLATGGLPVFGAAGEKATYPFKLPELPFALDALEPWMDAQTVQIHHGKHHQAYITKLNAALAKYPSLQKVDLLTLLRNLAALPDDIRTDVRNNGGSHVLHSLFWEQFARGGATEPQGELHSALQGVFNTVDACWEQLAAASLGQFGSGWGCLVMDPFGKLGIRSVPNQDAPEIDGYVTLLTIDVWEHAYYLKYQNRRVDFIQATRSLVNWSVVEANWQTAKAAMKA